MEERDVNVFVVVTDDAVDVSLIKSLTSSGDDTRAVTCIIVSTDDDSCCAFAKLPLVPFY